MTVSPRTRLASLGAVSALALTELVSRSVQARVLKLLVFLHVTLKQRAFETELQAALPSLEVRAVGRLADFERGLEEGQDAVMSLPLLLESHGLKARLQGLHAGAAEEKYAIVSAGTALDPARVTAIGALDLLGRDGTTAFVYGLLGSRPRIERVTKFEDLLPLLQMQRVDGILLPSRLFSEVQAESRIPLALRELTGLVKLPAVAAVGVGGSDATAAIMHLPAKVSKIFGVDGWR